MSSYRSNSTSDIREEYVDNSYEIGNFLQRVEGSFSTEVHAYERMTYEVIRSIQIRMKFIEEN